MKRCLLRDVPRHYRLFVTVSEQSLFWQAVMWNGSGETSSEQCLVITIGDVRQGIDGKLLVNSDRTLPVTNSHQEETDHYPNAG